MRKWYPHRFLIVNNLRDWARYRFTVDLYNEIHLKLWRRLTLRTYVPIEDEIMRGQYEEDRRPVRD